MNEIINVSVNDNQEPVVSGRQLHEALGVHSNYTTWFERMTEYGFVEGQDFLPNLEKVREVVELLTTLSSWTWPRKSL